MKTKSTLSAIGGWNSFFFCVGIYVVALFFSIFVCSAVFYAVNSRSDDNGKTSLSDVRTGKTEQIASIAR